jgi:hypothetical protein
MGAFKDAVIDELLDNNYVDLARQIDQIDNDVDVANYINSSKLYYTKTMPSKDLAGMPKFSSALFGELKTGKVDYNKEFGEDWYNKFEEIPYQEIEFVANKQGVNPKDLIIKMSEVATNKRREDISKGNNPDASLRDKVGGTALSLFGRRQQEAIARGEDPKLRDYAGDIGEQALYFAPYGAIAKGVGGASKVGKGLILGSNAVAPLATESYDSVAYGDSNPRGNFSVSDVAAGTATNAVAPWLIKGGAMGLGKWLNKPNFNKAVMEYANVDQPIREDRISRLLGGLRDSPHSTRQKFHKEIITNPEQASKNLTADQLAEGFNYDDAYKYKFDELYAKLAARQGTGFKADPTKPLRAGSASISYDYAMKDFTPAELKFIVNDPDLRKMLPSEISNMPTLTDVAGQEATKNYVTNQYGNIWAEDRDPWTRLGYPGVAISKKLKNDKAKEEAKLLKESILEELRNKYVMPENWDKEPRTLKILRGVK